jgi:hypothetical protein
MRKRTHRTRAISLIVVLVLIASFVGLRLYLPTLVLHKVNAALAGLENYQGHVDGVDISLLSGAYAIQGLKIEKRGDPVPLLSAKGIGFTVEWRALLHRRVLASVDVVDPILNIVKSAAPAAAASPSESIPATLRGMTPFDIDRITIENGAIHYRDFNSAPKIDLALTSIRAVARNLSNTPQPGVALPTELGVKGKAFKTGNFTLDLKLNPMKEDPTFELKHSLKDVQLTELNDFFDAYAKIKAKKGVFNFYAEVAAKDGKFIGFGEPFFKDMVIDKGSKAPVRAAWAVVASAVKWVFSNKSKKQVATKIPIEGTFEKTKTGAWAAAGGILKNAYIKALTPKVEDVKLKDVNKVKRP